MASERIGIEVEATVRDATMPHDQREAIVDMLGSAGHAANGAADKIQAIAEAVQSMAIFQARQARHEHQRRTDDIARHVDACPFRKASGAALVAWQYRRHLTAVAVALAASLGLARAAWMSRLMDVLAACAGVGQ